ncbi:MAG: reverse transcriptase domain-containing protein, partial [Candidatus Thiodiazotropha endolucinida]|nr:reverse transcriptase domain-containing protein [Candidatus Thiodiazotropha endolucinida]
MNLSVCSFNVRGLGNKLKREQMFAWLKQNKYSIIFLQETHSGDGTHAFWKQQWGHDAFFSGTSTNSEGIGILINPNLSYEVLKYTEILSGRIQSLEIKINERDITLINLYGPNNDDTSYFTKLERYLIDNYEKTFIIGGDFNSVLDIKMDKKNGRQDTNKLCRQKLISIIEQFDLIDIWREKHPDLRQYTWHSSSKPPIFSRLDYFLISNNLFNVVVSCEHKISYKSDHSIVTLQIDIKNCDRGPGYFKLNNSILIETNYQDIIKKKINEIAEINKDANPNTLWELIKGTVRNETIKYTTKKKKDLGEAEIKLKSDIDKLNKDLGETDNARETERINENLKQKQQELEHITDTKINGFILRSKAKIIDIGEKNSSYFANLEKKRSETKLISQLNKKDKIITDQKEILKETENFYRNLYAKRNTQNSIYNFFDENITKLNETETNQCEGLLSEEECSKALKKKKNQKSPGSDGLTVEFYKIFWNTIKNFYINSMNFSYGTGQLTDLQKQSIITLIPKSNKDTTDLTNWRPISLLNVDYKITTKAIANRIKSVLIRIINESQTGFIKGRYIGENIRLLFEIIEKSAEENKAGMIFFSDFEKAFDSLDHQYMLKCLEHFNFGDNLLTWIKLFYKDAKSCVTNNGNLSDFFPIQRGVRQGCPLSPYLFIISIELLSQMITSTEDIKGIFLCKTEFKKSLFADDASFILDGSPKSFETLISVLDNFSYVSGLTLNAKKCQVLRIGSLTKSETIYLKHKKFQWSSTKSDALGMTFTTIKENIFTLNLEPKINDFKKCLQRWQHRKLTLMGKITVIKNYALPKLIYALSSLPTPSEDTIKRIEKLMFNFIWDGKPEKIKRETLIKDYDKGGLKMIDLRTFIMSLKISWLKRMLDNDKNKLYKHIYMSELKPYGGKLFFESNYSEKDIENIKTKNNFFTDVLTTW